MPFRNPENWLLWPVLLGFIGGAITYVRDLKKKAGKFSPWEFCFAVLASGFIGYITAAVVKELGYSVEFAGAMAGVAGLMTRAMLDHAWQYISAYIRKKFGIEIK